MRSGNGRHRRPRQAPAIVVTAGVTGSALAMPLLAATSASAADTATWDKVAECESGGTWSADYGSGAYGGLQFTQEQWKDAGGLDYAPRADLASRSQQIAIAERVLAADGPGAWAHCGESAGLTRNGPAAAVDPGQPGPQPDRSLAPVRPEDRPEDSGSSDPTAVPGGVFTPGMPVMPAPLPPTEPVAPTAPTAPVAPTAPGKPTAPVGETPAPGTTPTLPATPGTPGTPGTPTGPTTPGTPTGPVDPTAPPVAPTTPGTPTTPATPGSPTTDPTAPTAPVSPTATTDPATPVTDPSGAPVAGTDTGTGRHRGAPAAEETAATNAKSEKTDPTYTVKAGDTLGDIADAKGLKGGWNALYAANEQVIGGDADLIKPGQNLDLSQK
ncbi:transglycosylase family protein [Streptomyces sp. NPDC002054]|uniref:LysM peptidoglycan-binding domain-containing protein n=1 Tax=Streptomyces sp. NPDC002054 TaxID=3154663 RepID=UPI003333764C